MNYTYNLNLAAWLDDTIVTVPDQIGDTDSLHNALDANGLDYLSWPRDAQKHHDGKGTVFPAVRPGGETIAVQLDGDAYGLNTSGTGAMAVRQTLTESLDGRDPAELPLMIPMIDADGGFSGWRDSGETVDARFGNDVGRLYAGASKGESQVRGCYDRRSVYLDGRIVVELRDTAAGLLVYQMDDDIAEQEATALESAKAKQS